VKNQVWAFGWAVMAFRYRILLRDTVLEASKCVYMMVVVGWLECLRSSSWCPDVAPPLSKLSWLLGELIFVVALVC
jgi:hypothetical protein